MQDASSNQQAKKKKQKNKLNHQEAGLPPHSVLPIRGEKKNSAQISPYMKLIQTTGPTYEGRNQKEEKIQPEALEKWTSKTIRFPKNEKSLKMAQIRNIEAQINEEEIGKLPEKEF